MAAERRRTVAYLRVSSVEQREQQTILTQRTAIDRWSLGAGAPIVETIEDDGVSGTVPLADRPGGARLLSLVADGLTGAGRRIDELVVYRLDRLGRDTIDVLRVVRDLSAAGVAVVSVTEPLDASNPGGQFVLTVLAGAATFERQSILQRSREGSRRLARDGVWLGGIVPYGYRVEGSHRHARLVASEAPIAGHDISEADVVRLAYRLVGEGRACSEVADLLNAQAVPPAYLRDGRTEIRETGTAGKRTRRVAGLWSPGRIRNMLVSTTYRGVHRYGKKRGRPAVTGSHADVGPIERAVPALVDDETWHRARSRLAGARLMRPNPDSRWRWLLRGVLRCADCGLMYVGVPQSGSGGHPLGYYRCGGKHRRVEYGKTRDRCKSKDLNASVVEGHIWADLDRFVRHPGEILDELAAHVDADVRAAEAHHADLAGLRRRLADKADERDRVIGLFRRRALPAEALDVQLDQIEREEAALRRQVEDGEQRLRTARLGAVMLGRVKHLLDELSARLGDDPTWETKRELVTLLVDRIEVTTTVDARGVKWATTRPRYRFTPVTSDDTGIRVGGSYGMVEREYLLPRRSDGLY